MLAEIKPITQDQPEQGTITQVQDYIENLFNLGVGLANSATQSVIDSGDIGAFRSIVENLAGDPVFITGFMS